MAAPAPHEDAPDSRGESLTKMLEEAREKGPEATKKLIAVLYEELRKLAAGQMDRERTGHTLQPTALANEVVIRLLGTDKPNWISKAHFLGAAATAMRRVLVDHARARNAAKRSGGNKVSMDSIDADPLVEPSGRFEEEIEIVDALLTELASLDERQAQIMEYKYFAGMDNTQIAELLGISVRTVEQQHTFAKRWMKARFDAK
ncbi:MAG: sigma-70 family RNA polymerase sigma factor [Planctomycetes bacterium]|nr:sigma-70 family RNA polymerase sigma factor [Planctomycetota bacterium]